jgi:hypothetical protein
MKSAIAITPGPAGNSAELAGRVRRGDASAWRKERAAMATDIDLLTAALAEALFASDLSASTRHTQASVEAAIGRAIRAHGSIRGCAGEMAAAYGEHPETAAPRMRWARAVVEDFFAAPAGSPAPLPPLGLNSTPADSPFPCRCLGRNQAYPRFCALHLTASGAILSLVAAYRLIRSISFSQFCSHGGTT